MSCEKAPIGIFITLKQPTAPMLNEAISAGFYKDTWSGRNYPAIQILTIEEILNGKQPNVPLTKPYHKQAQKTPVKKQSPMSLFSDIEKQ